MQLKLLKEVVTSIAGSNAAGLVDLLYGKKNVNEFLIAKKLNLNINQTRNILYKLVDEGMVSFVRKKDKKNGGWYTYYWTLDVNRSLTALRNTLFTDLTQLESQLQMRKSATFYYCQNCDIEMNEETALLNNFTCPECGEVLTLRDNTDLIKKLESSLEKRREQLALVDVELASIHEKDESTRQRKIKNEAKKKKEQRMLKRRAREKEKAALKPAVKPAKKTRAAPKKSKHTKK